MLELHTLGKDSSQRGSVPLFHAAENAPLQRGTEFQPILPPQFINKQVAVYSLMHNILTESYFVHP